MSIRFYAHDFGAKPEKVAGVLRGARDTILVVDARMDRGEMMVVAQELLTEAEYAEFAPTPVVS